MATLDNYPRPAQQTDVGFKISKPGYDASRTTGGNYIFNSSWPSLSIAFEKTVPTSVVAGNFINGVLTAHGLSFTPFTFIWVYGTDQSGKTGVVRRYCADVDGTNVYLTTTGTLANDTTFIQNSTQVHIKSFNLDLTKDIDYTLAPGDTYKIPYDPSYGIKFVKESKDINSKDMRDFIIHSRCQSPLILAVKTEQTSNTANPTYVQYSSKLTYPVWVYGFVRSTAGKYHYAAYNGQSYPTTATDGFVTTIRYASGAGDNGCTVVILRDPMFASNQLTVQY